MDIPDNEPSEVRQDTAELASYVLSDIESIHSGRSPVRRHVSPVPRLQQPLLGTRSTKSREDDSLSGLESKYISQPEMIPEVSEPITQTNRTSHSPPKSSRASILAQLISESNAVSDDDRLDPTNGFDSTDDETPAPTGVRPAIVDKGIISQPSERTALLLRKVALPSGSSTSYGVGSVHDLEGQKASTPGPIGVVRRVARQAEERCGVVYRTLSSPKSWPRRQAWKDVPRLGVMYIPAVVLGLLLNVLDAMSYGELESSTPHGGRINYCRSWGAGPARFGGAGAWSPPILGC